MIKISAGPRKWFVLLLLAIFFITACSPSMELTDSSEPGSDSPSVSTRSPGDSQGGSDEDTGENESDADPSAAVHQEWQHSTHATTFVVDDDGQNNSCARCHSPKNWMPTLDDIPESCSACKFELAPPPPFIEEIVWENVSCVTCHQVDKKGNVQPEVSWLEIPQLDEYAEVASHSELCLKCHDTEGIAEHGQVIVGAGHDGMECTECHSPHSATATCFTGDCHVEVLSDTDETPGHDEDHEAVTCAACHNSADWEVGVHPEKGIWVTFSPWAFVTKSDGEDLIIETGTIPFASHELGLEVNCERCHFSGNPWDLVESVEIP